MDIKKLSLLLMVMGFAVGCSSTPEEDQGETAPVPTPVVEEEQVEAAPAPEPMNHEAMNHEAMAPAADTSYVVVQGDNLWNISGKENIYGNPYQWPLIYKANRGQIIDADLIYSGQELSIERDMSDAAIDSAVNHAKSRGAWALGEVEASDQAYLYE